MMMVAFITRWEPSMFVGSKVINPCLIDLIYEFNKPFCLSIAYAFLLPHTAQTWEVLSPVPPPSKVLKCPLIAH